MGSTAAASLRSLSGIYDAKRDGGCAMNGTDDSTAFQSLINNVGGAGGGGIYIPPGVLFINQTFASQGAIYVKYDNIHIMGARRGLSIIRTGTGAQNNGVLVAQGQYKPNGIDPSAPGSTTLLENTTVYPLTGSTVKGASAITTATPADAGNFTAGDQIWITTGQTITGSAKGNPDSELNEVLTANASTGVITLKYPTVKPYQQEYYNSGTTGLTSTTPNANPAQYGCAKVNDRVIRGFSLSNLTIDHSAGLAAHGNCTHMQCVLDLDYENLEIICRSNAMGGNNVRRVTMDKIKVHSNAGTTNNVSCIGTFGRGSCDVQMDHCYASSEANICAVGWVEGASGLIAHNMIFRNSDIGSAAGQDPLFVQSRARDAILDGMIIVNGGPSGNSIISIAQNCADGGIVDKIIVDGVSQTNAFKWQSAGWRFGPTNYSKSGNTAPMGTGLSPPLSPSYVGVLAGRFDIAKSLGPNLTLGVIPVNATVIGVTVDVTTAFDGTGTKDVNIGYSGTDAAYVSSAARKITDGSASDWATTGSKALTFGTEFGGDTQTARTVVAKYLASGATTGKALITVSYALTTQAPT